ncbi:MAG TPA: hypothetical protein VNW04_06120 [Puia sp.]|nr:hypothetical protein [Puia sp.]
MKNLPGFLLLILIALQPACKKNADAVGETMAHIRFGGEPALDGIGYYIVLDSTKEAVMPINLPSGYKQEDVNAAVAVRIVDTGKKVFPGMAGTAGPGMREVYIVTIRKL